MTWRDRPYALTADQFLAMIEAKIFPREDRVYLRDGMVREKDARTQTLTILRSVFTAAIIRASTGRCPIIADGSFRLDDRNVELPDLAMLRECDPRVFLAASETLKMSDVALAIEIAVTDPTKALGDDRERHARAMVPCYWVADVAGRCLIVHTGPRIIDGGGNYQRIAAVRPGEMVDLILEGREPLRFAYKDLML